MTNVTKHYIRILYFFNFFLCDVLYLYSIFAIDNNINIAMYLLCGFGRLKNVFILPALIIYICTKIIIYITFQNESN